MVIKMALFKKICTKFEQCENCPVELKYIRNLPFIFVSKEPVKIN